MEHLSFDASQVVEGLKRAGREAVGVIERAETKAALELGRLSIKEVPHDKGMLQDSQTVGHDSEGGYVGYNMVYAAHLHEHPEYHFQKGRKGKFLEDPLKANLDKLAQYMAREVGNALGESL